MKLRNKVLVAIVASILLTAFQPVHTEAQESTGKIYKQITNLLAKFKTLTQVQQDRWDENNEWKYWVKGKGKVSEVEEANSFSEISGDYYEVTVELSDGNRAVIFYPKTEEYEWVVNLKKNSRVSFKGNLKSLKDWGLWMSGYILV